MTRKQEDILIRKIRRDLEKLGFTPGESFRIICEALQLKQKQRN